MAEIIKTLPLEFIVGLTNYSDVEELTANLTKDGEPLTEAEQLEAIKTATGLHNKTVSDAGYKRGQKEALKNLEKDIREELGGEGKGIDLVKSAIEKAKKATIAEFKANNPEKKLTDLDDKEAAAFVVNSDVYKSKIAEVIQERDEARNEAQKSVSEFEQKLVLGRVEKIALAKLQAMKVPLSEDETRRQNQINLYLNLVKTSGQFKTDGDSIQVLDTNGLPVEIDHKPATADQWLTGLINSNYDVPPIDPAKASPNGHTQQTSGGGSAGTKPDYSQMSKEEAYKHALSLNGEEQTAAIEAFAQADKAGTFKEPA